MIWGYFDRSNKVANPMGYEVTQIHYHFQYLTILAVNNFILPFKLFQVPMSSF